MIKWWRGVTFKEHCATICVIMITAIKYISQTETGTYGKDTLL